MSPCRICRLLPPTPEHAAKRRETQRLAYAKNPQHYKEKERNRRASNPEHARLLESNRRRVKKDRYDHLAKLRRLKNRVKINQDAREYRRKNVDKFKRYYEKERLNVNYRLNAVVSAAIIQQMRLRQIRKTAPKAILTGWTIDELREHLETLFENDMHWENYGQWQIDHIVPLSRVKFSSVTDPLFKAAWALSNLAPLWAVDNNVKKAALYWQPPAHYVNPALRLAYSKARWDIAA